MTISIIAARARNGVIGHGNKLPWHLPSDLKHFKTSTLNQPVILGWNTWESFPFKPLPSRPHYVLSRTRGQSDMDDYAEVSDKRNSPLIVCSKLTDAIIQALGALEIKMYREKNLDLSAWIIGGAQLYREALERDCVDRMVLSEIDADIDGDVFFPDFDKDAFIEVSRVPVRDDALPYDIVTYERKIS